jgi:hypothetical protein
MARGLFQHRTGEGPAQGKPLLSWASAQRRFLNSTVVYDLPSWLG